MIRAPWRAWAQQNLKASLGHLDTRKGGLPAIIESFGGSGGGAGGGARAEAFPAISAPLAGMGGGGGGGTAARGTGGGLAALRGVFCAVESMPVSAAPCRVNSAALTSASPRGRRPVAGFLLICIAVRDLSTHVLYV